MEVNWPVYGTREDVLDTVMSGEKEEYVQIMMEMGACNLPRPSAACNALCFAFKASTDNRARYLLQQGITPAQCSTHHNILLSYPSIAYSLLTSGELIKLHKKTVYNLIQAYLFKGEEQRAVTLLNQYISELDLRGSEKSYLMTVDTQRKDRVFRCHSRPLGILAIETEAEQCWSLLISSGFDLEIEDEHGWTALIAAASLNSLGKVQTLLSIGAAIDHTDKTNRTALHQASQYGYLPIVTTLIEAGASANIASSDGDFAYDLALDNSHKEVMQYLTRVGADKKRLRQQCVVA